MNTDFTTGKSAPVRIAGKDLDPAGEPLDPVTGKAVLIATGQTAAESHILFRRDDFYASTEVCIYFD